MRIRRLELHGFKSFADRTVFRLSPGICAVVGPNGCGKSNVVDALRWTLGEQSAGTLRGKAMEDVVFAGAQGRGRAGVAEVLVAFDNEDGRFGGEFARFKEIEIGRRLHRGGRSEYLLNKRPCRLKDIKRLFLDTGVGARAYSIIEQGRVAFIVHARPEERRVLLDEVAGINTFKAQREEAERRLERARSNLTRAGEFAADLDRRRRALRTEAEKTERFLGLRAAWRAAAICAGVAEALAARAALSEADSVREGLDDAERTEVLRIEALTAESEARRRAAATLADRLTDLRAAHGVATQAGRLARQESRLGREELARIEATAPEYESEQAESERRRKSFAQSLSGRRANQEAARVALAREELRLVPLTEKEARLVELAEAARREVEASKATILRAMRRAAQAQAGVAASERLLADLRARLEAGARSEEERRARVTEAAGRRSQLESAAAAAEERVAALRRERDAALRERADAMDAAAAVERAHAEVVAECSRLEARRDALAELVTGVADLDDAVRELLSEPPPGVLGLVADLLPPSSVWAERLAGQPDVLGAVAVRGVDLEALPAVGVSYLPVGEGPAAGAVLDAIESGIVRVQGRRELLGSAARSLSADGWLGDRVLVRAPGPTAVTGRLQRRAALVELERRHAEVRANLDASAGRRAQASATLARASGRSDELDTALHAAELAHLRAIGERERAASEHQAADAALEGLAVELAELRVRAASTATEQLDAEAIHASAEADQRAAEAALVDHRAGLAEVEEEARAHARELSRLRTTVADLHRLAEAADREVAYAEERLKDAIRTGKRAGRALDRLTRRREALALRLEELETTAAAAEAEATRHAAAVPGVARAAEDAAEASATVREERTTAEAGLRALRRRREDAARSSSEARAVLEALRARMAAEFDVDLGAVVEEFDRDGRIELGQPNPARVLDRKMLDEPIPAHHHRVLKLEARLDALGPVDPNAPDEFEAVDAEWRARRAVVDDLEAAISDLVGAIGRIERETKERFRLAFDAVAERFAALYPRLVGGGAAELRLADPSDLLGTGIEIVVQPPGKRLSHLTLLSGGEKAMAAVALLFAVFQVKPSPFCVLDEVDAPLDEANSRRFNDMLRELSAETQFIVITHNRTTMEVADVLHGVTMQDPGVSTTVSVRLDA